jgi:hypothetical protein
LDRISEDGEGSRPWLIALLYALGIDALVIGLFYFWFGVADRHLVFLYDHEMGPYCAGHISLQPDNEQPLLDGRSRSSRGRHGLVSSYKLEPGPS